MPQGRKKVPFSGKAKKLQMQVKKHRKIQVLLTGNGNKHNENDESEEAPPFVRGISKINEQQQVNGKKNKYALQFFQETKEELQNRREEARKPIVSCSMESQEISDNYFPVGIDMPKRPPWDFAMSKQKLELQEQRYFNEYLTKVESLVNISYFELNLETWRQLWRVLEMSDVILIIVDIRYPIMMFPPYLYDYITKDLNKDMILVLNKVDLAPPSLVVAWQEYFKTVYPKLHILIFTSFPAYNLVNKTNNEKTTKVQRKMKLKMAAEGAQKIMEACKQIVGDKIDLTSWYDKIEEEIHAEFDQTELEREENVIIEKNDTSYFKHERYKNGVLTIGCIGTPNVGKSSLINALKGQKVVSVSRTPGHTKHFQTIFVTKNVCLCDCPGLVFPSTVPKQFQILMGSFPIAQVREPYHTIKFLAERIDLPKLLKLHHQDNDTIWSAMDICDSWAAKKNYRTARAARLDTYRAANSILRMTLEGKICLNTYPPEWSIKKENWEKHPDIEIVKWIQATNHTDNEKFCITTQTSSESDDDIEDSTVLTKNSTSVVDSESSEESQVAVVVNKFIVLSTEL